MDEVQLHEEKEYIYDAFISYRHSELDIAVAKKLHYLLENYRIPRSIAKQTGIKKIKRIFRDQEELPTSSNLSEDIQNALINSRYLIVVCSQDTPKSRWCCEEIKTFKAIHGRDKILSILIKGEPQESFPADLRLHKEMLENEDGTIYEKEIELEPLAADIRGKNLHDMIKKLKLEKLRLLAPMLGVKFDDLRQRHREQKMRNIASAAVAVSVFFAAFGSFSLYQSNVISAQSVELKKSNEEITKKNKELEEQIAETGKQRDLAQKNGDEAVKQARAAELNADLAKENERKALVNLHEAEAQKALALSNEKLANENAKKATYERERAEEQRDEALKNQSLYLANLSRQEVEKGDKVTGMLLALEALPKNLNDPEKPYVGEAESALYNSIFHYQPLSIISNDTEAIEGHTWFYHNGADYAEISDNNTRVLTHSSSPNSIKLWDEKTGKLLRSLSVDDNKFGTYDSFFASFIDDNKIIVQDTFYDKYEFKKYRIFAKDIVSGTDVYSIDNIKYSKFSKEADRIVMQASDGTVTLNSLDNGKLVKSIMRTDAGISSCFSSNGSRIAIYSAGAPKVIVIDTKTGDTLSVKDTGKKVADCKLNADGTMLAVLDDESIEIYDMINNKMVSSYKGNVSYAGFDEFSSSGSKFVCILGSDIIFMNLQNGNIKKFELTIPMDSGEGAKLTPDGKKLVVGDGCGQGHIFDTESGNEIASIKQSDQSYLKDYCDVKISPDGENTLTYSMDNKVKLWNLQYGEELASIDKQSGRTSYASFDKSGKKIIIVSVHDGAVSLWDLGKPDKVKVLGNGTGKPIRIDFSQNGKVLNSYTHNDYLDSWDMETDNLIDEIHVDEIDMNAQTSHDMCSKAQIDNDSRKILVKGKINLELSGHLDYINSVRFSCDDSKLLTASRDKTAIIWDSAAGKPLQVFKHPEGVTQAEFSPDGSRVVTAAGNKAYIWSSSDGHLIAELDKHTGMVNSVEYSSDGKYISTASSDFTVILWDGQSGAYIRTLNKHKDIVNHARFSPDGKRIVSSSDDETARVWDRDTGSEIAVLDLHENCVNDAIFSPDGSMVVTASSDKLVRVWSMFKNTQELVDYARKQLDDREITDEEYRKFYIRQ